VQEVKPRGPPRAEFDAVYRRELGFVWRTLRYYGVSETEVEDAVQEVFVVVHRRWRDWDGRRAWLYSVVRRVASAHRRRQSRHERRLGIAPPPKAERAVEDAVADQAALESLRAALAGMDEKLAAVFVLTEIEGMTAPEIAATLGDKVNTVYWRLRTARAQVAAAMGSAQRGGGSHD